MLVPLYTLLCKKYLFVLVEMKAFIHSQYLI